MKSLEPIKPSKALDLYLADRQGSLAKNSLKTHRYRLKRFVNWLDERGIDNLNDLSGRLVKEYQLSTRQREDWAPMTERGHVITIRVFVRWCQGIEAVENGLVERIQVPVVDEEDQVKDTQLDTQRAELVLEHLDRFKFCSREHVTLALIWHTMARKSAVRGLDVRDFDADEQYVQFRHRPGSDTPLKNKHKSERHVALSDDMADLLEEWIEKQRPDVIDDYGRQPLISTEHGRISTSTIGQYAYRYTRPCEYTISCTEDRDPETCEATEYGKEHQCPASLSPHPFRRGAITHWLYSDVPPHAVSSRADVSEGIIEKHYDERTEIEKMEQRRGYLENI